MKPILALLAALGMLSAGCGADGTTSAQPPAPTATVTVTATATATATVTAAPDRADLEELVAALEDLPTSPVESPRADPPPPRLHLEVFTDGCGVIRSEPRPGVSYQNLTWSFLDQDGFQVLGRNAEGETRYRYFQGGSYDVVLEAYVDGAYRPVSNKVTVSC